MQSDCVAIGAPVINTLPSYVFDRFGTKAINVSVRIITDSLKN